MISLILGNNHAYQEAIRYDFNTLIGFDLLFGGGSMFRLFCRTAVDAG
jgi:hypothetical protein